MENKKLICEKLLSLLQYTDNLSDLYDLQYKKLDNGDEIVEATFLNGSTKKANVTMDSGTSMIHDIIGQII